MEGGIRERVEELRREIAEIQKLNLAFLQMPRPDFMAMNDHERRQQRLREIMDELRSMTVWYGSNPPSRNVSNLEQTAAAQLASLLLGA